MYVISTLRTGADYLSRLNIMISLMSLRLIMLFLCALSLVIWHFSVEPYDYWSIITPMLVVVGLWSVFTLYQDTKETEKEADIKAIVRELLIDYGWVFVLVYCAGRGANPFIYYYLVLTALSAALLSKRIAWGFCGLGIATYSLLLLLDVKVHFSHFSLDYRIHLVAMWLNYVVSTVVICFFVSHLITLLRQRDKQLALTREKNLRKEQLIAVATVSASTIHDLATPLSTLSVLGDDLLKNKTLDTELKNDLLLMQTQVKRCHDTIKSLGKISQNNNELVLTPVNKIVCDLKEHYALHYPSAQLAIDHDIKSEEFIQTNPLFHYALVNLINNALEAAAGTTRVTLILAVGFLSITIQNESKLSRKTLLSRWGKTSESEKQAGLGIGSLLANSTIEQQGGIVELRTADVPDNVDAILVVVHVRFPVAANAPN